ncbi:MAG: hypothetical protein CMD72_04430 [Gammaproteobacteria bacterium]|nr:hypothetical protein [Gammaproteobacteria bacterium]|tara:strand:+ start:133 stop:699 length:567 start_codon:yes stop_codon:yes gene_type:complete
MSDKEYLKYLQNISWKGKLYRNYFLYPLIEKWCKGEVLDLGCGVGNFLKRNNNFVGVDVNNSCVDYCKALDLNARKMEIDILPFEANSFDAVVLDNVLEHIEEPTDLMNEISRVLNKDGRLIILVPGEKGFEQDDDHKKFYNFSSLSDLSKRHNFLIEKNSSVPLPFTSKILSFFCYFVVLMKDCDTR